MKDKITILLVDDHAIVRAGYCSLLKKQAGLQVIAEASDGEQAYRYFKACTPDLVIMDLSLPGQSGLETIARIRQRRPNAKILVFSMHQHPGFAVQALRAGALGYITKSSAPEVLIRAIREAHAGRRVLSPDIAAAVALENSGYEAGLLATLTVRELEILRMLAQGRPKQDIAESLHISLKTVSNSHYLIKRKLNAASDIELMRLSIRMNVVDLQELSGPADSTGEHANGLL